MAGTQAAFLCSGKVIGGHWKLSLCCSDDTICTTTQNSAPASTFIEETDSIDILFILMIVKFLVDSPSTWQRNVLYMILTTSLDGQEFHHLHAIHGGRDRQTFCNGPENTYFRLCQPHHLGCQHLTLPSSQCESNRGQDVNKWPWLHLTNFILKKNPALDEEIMTWRPSSIYLRIHTNKKQTTMPTQSPALSGSKSSACSLHHTVFGL